RNPRGALIHRAELRYPSPLARGEDESGPPPSRLFQHPLVARFVLEDRHDPAPAVDAYALAVLDPLRRLAGPDHRRQVVLARDDGHVAHRPADVGYRRADALEDRAPGRVGDLAHQDIALLDTADFFD